jgi:hypothetical protein
MAEKDQGNEDDLKLELPSLSFGRRRKRKAGQAAAESPAGQPTDAAAEPAPPARPEEPVAETSADASPTEAVPQTPDRFAPPPADPQTVHEPPPAPYVAPETDGADDLAARPEPPATQPFEGAEDDEPTAVLPDTRTAGAPEPPKPAKAPKPARPPRQAPRLSGPVAAALVGAFVGILACGATYVGLLGCQEIKGTSSCGGPGFFLLLAILVALIWLGGRLLGLLGIGDAGSTSFLGVGMLAVVALAFLIDVIFEWWMILVIPGVGALTFFGAHWLTARFAEPTTH